MGTEGIRGSHTVGTEGIRGSHTVGTEGIRGLTQWVQRGSWYNNGVSHSGYRGDKGVSHNG